jgi:hypothetical protein
LACSSWIAFLASGGIGPLGAFIRFSKSDPGPELLEEFELHPLSELINANATTHETKI